MVPKIDFKKAADDKSEFTKQYICGTKKTRSVFLKCRNVFTALYTKHETGVVSLTVNSASFFQDSHTMIKNKEK